MRHFRFNACRAQTPAPTIPDSSCSVRPWPRSSMCRGSGTPCTSTNLNAIRGSERAQPTHHGAPSQHRTTRLSQHTHRAEQVVSGVCGTSSPSTMCHRRVLSRLWPGPAPGGAAPRVTHVRLSLRRTPAAEGSDGSLPRARRPRGCTSELSSTRRACLQTPSLPCAPPHRGPRASPHDTVAAATARRQRVGLQQQQQRLRAPIRVRPPPRLREGGAAEAQHDRGAAQQVQAGGCLGQQRSPPMLCDGSQGASPMD